MVDPERRINDSVLVLTYIEHDPVAEVIFSKSFMSQSLIHLFMIYYLDLSLSYMSRGQVLVEVIDCL
jgi:hypothetical protein